MTPDSSFDSGGASHAWRCRKRGVVVGGLCPPIGLYGRESLSAIGLYGGENLSAIGLNGSEALLAIGLYGR